jgi:hypothetical protein
VKQILEMSLTPALSYEVVHNSDDAIHRDLNDVSIFGAEKVIVPVDERNGKEINQLL